MSKKMEFLNTAKKKIQGQFKNLPFYNFYNEKLDFILKDFFLRTKFFFAKIKF
jgi:hypothetical protein